MSSLGRKKGENGGRKTGLLLTETPWLGARRRPFGGENRATEGAVVALFSKMRPERNGFVREGESKTISVSGKRLENIGICVDFSAGMW